MHLSAILLAMMLAPLALMASDEKDAVAVVQKTFDGLAARDAATIRSTMLPDARIFAVRGDAAPAGVSIDEFLQRIATAQGSLLERFTGEPTVSIRGRMAQIWGEYEFLHDGQFSHCGVDSVSLFKTADGWKIAAIAYTAETTGCKGH
ncbi:MAG TPA: nuclear transport factor 2 family protein [Bryobacteraceae bacterium]|nr:nuclear transport factor 2 family protein [Bryobacteraceae bacterium]